MKLKRTEKEAFEAFTEAVEESGYRAGAEAAWDSFKSYLDLEFEPEIPAMPNRVRVRGAVLLPEGANILDVPPDLRRAIALEAAARYNAFDRILRYLNWAGIGGPHRATVARQILEDEREVLR